MADLRPITGIVETQDGDYAELLGGLAGLLQEARHAAARSVNTILTATYWEMGRQIVEFEQRGERRAEYGQQLLSHLARDLTARFGRGFGPTNLSLIRRFYLIYEGRRPIFQSATEKSPAGPSPRVDDSSRLAPASPAPATSTGFILSFTHYVRLLTLDEPHRRDFYEEEARRGGWSVRQLDRQINSMLYERVALSRRKGELLEEAERGGVPTTAHYALGGLSNQVFASRYRLQLPELELLEREIEAERRRLEARRLP